MTDWSVIRQEYEQGDSLRILAARHGVSKSLIGKKKFQEKWTENKLRLPPVDTGVDMPPPVHFPIASDIHTIADLLLAQIATHLQGTLEIRDIKSASDALASCAKVKQMPRETETQDGLVIPLEKLLPQTRRAIRELLAEDEQIQQEARVG